MEVHLKFSEAPHLKSCCCCEIKLYPDRESHDRSLTKTNVVFRKRIGILTILG